MEALATAALWAVPLGALVTLIVFSRLKAAYWEWEGRRSAQALYDWQEDNGLMDVWAREAEGQLVRVLPYPTKVEIW